MYSGMYLLYHKIMPGYLMTWRLFFGITANIETYIAYVVIITGIVYEVMRLFINLSWREHVSLSLKTFH